MRQDPKRLEAELRKLLPQSRGRSAAAIRFMLAHQDELPVRSMRELAKRAGVAPVTLVRIAQKLGFDGFEEFRARYVEALVGARGYTRRQAESLISLARSEGALGFAAKFLEREFEILRQTLTGLSERQLEAAVRDIVAAKRVFIIGRRSLYPAAFSVAYALRKAKPNTHLLDVGGGLATELDGLGAQDLLIGFSTHPYSNITATLAEAARAQGAKIIAITDSPDSPLGRHAHHVFLTLVEGYAFPDSICGAQTIGNILVGLAVAGMGAEALARISGAEGQIKRLGEIMG
jgi:DNA-binding MurR/RpiR family transcriptional regulator